LTPTDLLHVTGEYAPWDADAARVVAERLGRLRGWDVDEFIERVKVGIAERIVGEVVAFLTERPLPPPLPHPAGRVLGRWLFDNSISRTNPYLETRLRLRMPIVGIGAPAGIFLPRVADLLHTDLILPDHFAVANAVGAVAASVVARQEAHVYPRVVQRHVAGHYVQCAEERRHFDRLEAALDHATAAARRLSLAAAREAGAADPEPTVEIAADSADAYRITARAVGSPRVG
jgi:N-methylhydantoinase A/oxoprolinase/acetone carboxylase beta subunit